MNTIRILMVEDEVGFSACYADWFREADVLFDVAETVHSAIERVTDFVYDVAFLDYHIGSDLGTDVLAAVSHLPNASRLRFYAMTGDARPEIIDACKRAGFVDTLIKPFRHSAFMELLQTEETRLAVFG